MLFKTEILKTIMRKSVKIDDILKKINVQSVCLVLVIENIEVRIDVSFEEIIRQMIAGKEIV